MSEKLTYNQVNQQESSAYMNKSDANPSVLIKRSGGGVTVGQLNMENRDVNFREGGQGKYHPSVPLEKFSDQRQAELATELAVDGIKAAMKELEALMAESDREPAWRYAIAQTDNEVNIAISNLSGEGIRQAIRYRELFEKLKEARGDR